MRKKFAAAERFQNISC